LKAQSQEPNLRFANQNDILALMALEREAPTAAHWSAEQYRDAVGSRIVPRIVLVIEKDLRLLGFLVARAVEREWEIENVVVAEAARRSGFGSRLLMEFLNIAHSRGAAEVSLEVRESNTGARRFYESCNFQHLGSRLRYYRNPEENAALYRLMLSR